MKYLFKGLVLIFENKHNYKILIFRIPYCLKDDQELPKLSVIFN